VNQCLMFWVARWEKRPPEAIQKHKENKKLGTEGHIQSERKRRWVQKAPREKGRGLNEDEGHALAREKKKEVVGDEVVVDRRRRKVTPKECLSRITNRRQRAQ